MNSFLREYFLKKGFENSLNSFQDEFYSKEKDTKEEIIPDVYLKNRILEDENIKLKNELIEEEKLYKKSLEGRDEIIKQRNYHKLHHKRVHLEKEFLIKKLKMFKTKIENYDPIIIEVYFLL
jgi:sperm-associated antigen 16 protein